MKKSLVALALIASFGAFAQDTSSNAGSNANSGSSSSINSTAVGNTAASGSDSRSNSGANSGSTSGAQGNSVTLNQNVPSTQNINSNVSGQTRAETILNGGTTNTENIKYSGVVENRSTGGTTNTLNENVHYSGTQTIKNVPGIAMSGPASGPCTGVSGGLSAAGPGFGVGINGSAVMVDCRLRENTRVLGMAMQSIDGGANPQERGEVTVLFMDAVRGLAAYNQQLLGEEVKPKK